MMRSITDYLAKDPARASFLPGTQLFTSMQSAYAHALDNMRQHPAAHDKFGQLMKNFAPQAAGPYSDVAQLLATHGGLHAGPRSTVAFGLHHDGSAPTQ